MIYVDLNPEGKENVWNYFSKEYEVEDYSDFFNPFALLTFFQKNNRTEFNVAYWNIGRQLIVKAVNQFIRNSWPLQSFIGTFSNKREFTEALLYCCTFEKGTQLIKRLLSEIDEDKLLLNKDQSDIVRKIWN